MSGVLLAQFSGKGILGAELTGTPAFALAVAGAAAGAVLLATRLGLPVSTTHVSVGALFGIGAVRGGARWRTVSAILASWLVLQPFAAGIAAALWLAVAG